MSARIVDLASRRTSSGPCCPRCELDALAARIRQRLEVSDALLIARTDLEAALADLEATVERLLPRRTHAPTKDHR